MQYTTQRSVTNSSQRSPATTRLAPRRILEWVYLARFALSSAIFLAAVLAWKRAAQADTLVASLAFTAVMIFTGASALYTEVYRRPISEALLYSQMVFDALLVTAIVHVTWEGGGSQFVPVYILVIAVAALLLPPRGVLIVAALGIALYVADAIWAEHIAVADIAVMFQLLVFCSVALGCGYIAARLREAGLIREELAEELARFRLRQGDVERLHLRAERLEAITELSAAMAHEIKNPLAAIRSAVEQIAMTPHSTEDDRMLSVLVQRESDRLSRLLSGFLDFAHFNVPHLQRLDVTTLARQAGELALAHPDKPEGVHIEYDLVRESLQIDGDADMLHRALFNLILNALQVSHTGGVVRIETAELLPHQLDSHAPMFERGAIAIRVIDAGAEISEDVRAKLFHPFFTTKPGGTGLGLAIAHRAIEAHQGVVLVDSDTRGSRFTVLLPHL